MEHHHHHEADEHSKYEAALALYETNLSDDEVKAKTAHIIEKYVAENNTLEVKKFLFNCIDLTTLKTEDSEESVLKFTERVNDFEDKYPDLKNVAAICVYPCFAKIVSQSLEVEDVNIACVSAGFPSSQTFTEVKVAETALALADGATEIDIVIPVGKFLSGDYEGMCDEIEEIKTICDCGAKATVNARLDESGRVVTAGAQVLLGGNDRYVAMCHRCWKKRIREQN